MSGVAFKESSKRAKYIEIGKIDHRELGMRFWNPEKANRFGVFLPLIQHQEHQTGIERG